MQRIIFIALIIGFPVALLAAPDGTFQSQRCEAVGIVVERNGQRQRVEEVCREGTRGRQNVAILCYETGRRQPNAHTPCPELGRTTPRFYPRQYERRYREPRSQMKVVEIHPRGSILQDQPTLRWEGYPQATHYITMVQGYGFSWRGKSETNITPLPQLQRRETYEVHVVVFQGEKQLAQGSTLLEVASVDHYQASQVFKQELDGLGLAPAKYNQALSQYYFSQGYIAEALEQWPKEITPIPTAFLEGYQDIIANYQ